MILDSRTDFSSQWRSKMETNSDFKNTQMLKERERERNNKQATDFRFSDPTEGLSAAGRGATGAFGYCRGTDGQRRACTSFVTTACLDTFFRRH